MNAHQYQQSNQNPVGNSLTLKVAQRLGLSETEVYEALLNNVFKMNGKGALTQAQILSVLHVIEQYRLNPFLREIYAFPDRSGNIIPVLSVDGWIRIMNEHPSFDGVEFEYDDQAHGMTCIIHLKNRSQPVKITEYYSECFRENSTPWKTHPRRMLRHKALAQCVRIAFGFSGVYEPDEAQAIIDNSFIDSDLPVNNLVQTQKLQAISQKAHNPVIIKEAETEEKHIDNLTQPIPDEQLNSSQIILNPFADPVNSVVYGHEKCVKLVESLKSKVEQVGFENVVNHLKSRLKDQREFDYVMTELKNHHLVQKVA